jgi:hypothetical protein
MGSIEPDYATDSRVPATCRGAMALIAMLCAIVPASAQTPASDQHPYGLDPYKPSDAALLRDYGVTLVAQTPLLELRKLDPYKPSHAALLRDLGGALPLWGIAWYPGPMPASLTPFPAEDVTLRPAAPVKHQGNDLRGAPDVAAAPTSVAPLPPSSIRTLRRPENNDGVWILFENQKWISAGHTVPFEQSKFVRVGEYDNFPVFRRTGATEDVIYVPTGQGQIAPYRLRP